LTGSAADAEDLTQQVFLIAQAKAGQVRDAASARAWLYAVLRNCYLKNRRQRVPLPASDIELNIERVPAEEAEREIDSERLQAAIDRLPDEFKLAVMLFYFEQRSYREMAEIMEVPPGTVMSRLSRAKAFLRSQLTETEAPAPLGGPAARRPALVRKQRLA
jgi:RNA polymerase sigma-70 factor (ECF subfamily)